MSTSGAVVTSRTITRNTIWNLAGVAAPIPAALVAIPLLIRALGQDRFGLLTIAWTLMGYFGLFDLGLARATTKYVAEAAHAGNPLRVRDLFWTSIGLNLILGSIGGLLLFAGAPYVERTLAMPEGLRGETTFALRLLAVSVPVIVLTSVVRGVLEALHRFDLVNAVKLPAGLFTYLGPLVAVAFTAKLPPVVLVIAIGRVAVLVAYLLMCFRLLPPLRDLRLPERSLIGPLATMGGWLTATTILTPVMVSIDRFAIGSAVSVAAVTTYAAPYEVVTKMWIFSASLLGVLFPAFSVLGEDAARLSRLYWRAVTALLLVTTPVAGILVAFAPEFFRAWLGPEIASEGVVVARWLAVGVVVNVIAQVPFTALQATSHADVTGRLQLAELPLYALGVYAAAARWGVTGVAIAWTVRSAVDALLMFGAVRRRLPQLDIGAATAPVGTVTIAAAFLVWCWSLDSVLGQGLALKAAAVACGVAPFPYMLWQYAGGTLRPSALMTKG